MLTVAICTWNRSFLLARTLEQLGALIVPPGLRWELLVVDNASSDDTSQVLQGYLGRLPLRVVREERPGLSNARNAAIRAARGEYIIWTDDDVLVAPGWLAAYSDAF